MLTESEKTLNREWLSGLLMGGDRRAQASCSGRYTRLTKSVSRSARVPLHPPPLSVWRRVPPTDQRSSHCTEGAVNRPAGHGIAAYPACCQRRSRWRRPRSLHHQDPEYAERRRRPRRLARQQPESAERQRLSRGHARQNPPSTEQRRRPPSYSCQHLKWRSRSLSHQRPESAERRRRSRSPGIAANYNESEMTPASRTWARGRG